MRKSLYKKLKKNKIDTDNELKMNDKDLWRLTKFIDKDIFDTDECVLWKGRIDSRRNYNSSIFYLNGKCRMLIRVLFFNFNKNMKDRSYIRGICEHRGACCNPKHYAIMPKIYVKRKQTTPQIKFKMYYELSDLHLCFDG